MSILGNPITLGGGGADLNIDFGSTPPTDTSKLWVPLTKKPSNISLQTGVDVGDFSLKTVNIVDASGAKSSIPQYCGISDDGAGGWYCFGGGAGTVSYGAKASKTIWHITSGGVIEQLSQQLVYVTANPWCIRAGIYIYIFGGFKNPSSYNQAGGPMIQKFNIQTKETTYIWSSEQFQYTSSAGGPWRDGCKLFKYGKYLILAGGNYQENDTYGDGGQGDNQIRYLDTTNDTFAIRRILPSSHIYETKPCAITKDSILAAFYTTSSNTGYSYDLDTYTTVQTPPTIPNDKINIANNSSLPFYYSGKSYVITPYGNIYEYNPGTNSFASSPIKSLSINFNVYYYVWSYNDGHAYIPNGDKLYICDVQSELSFNNMIVTLDIEGVPWKALNSSNAQATVYPIKVLVGNSAGYAEEKIAYLYDASTSKWTKLDGSSTYQDMLNALNIMGVT